MGRHWEWELWISSDWLFILESGAPPLHEASCTTSTALEWSLFDVPLLECIPISLKLIQVSLIPLDIYNNILYPFKFLANIPVSLKTLPGPQLYIPVHAKRSFFSATHIRTAYTRCVTMWIVISDLYQSPYKWSNRETQSPK